VSEQDEQEEKKLRPLTGLQAAFVEFYVINGFNAYAAARDAGYQGSYASLRRTGSENLTKRNIKAALAERFKERGMKADEVIARITAQAEGAGEYIQPDGTIDMERLVSDGKGHLIKCIRPTKHGDVIEFYPADKALELLARHHGLLADKLKHEGEVKHIHRSFEDALNRGYSGNDDGGQSTET
jgi:phage terminase small subunit